MQSITSEVLTYDIYISVGSSQQRTLRLPWSHWSALIGWGAISSQQVVKGEERRVSRGGRSADRGLGVSQKKSVSKIYIRTFILVTDFKITGQEFGVDLNKYDIFSKNRLFSIRVYQHMLSVSNTPPTLCILLY